MNKEQNLVSSSQAMRQASYVCQPRRSRDDNCNSLGKCLFRGISARPADSPRPKGHLQGTDPAPGRVATESNTSISKGEKRFGNGLETEWCMLAVLRAVDLCLIIGLLKHAAEDSMTSGT